MTNTELESSVVALAHHNLTALFERIANTYNDGLQIARKDVAVLVEARLVKHARGRAHLTGAGWLVSTRIAAHAASRAITAAGPGYWRTRA